MTKAEWLMLLTIAIPVLPALLREIGLFWEVRWRKRRMKRDAQALATAYGSVVADEGVALASRDAALAAAARCICGMGIGQKHCR